MELELKVKLFLKEKSYEAAAKFCKENNIILNSTVIYNENDSPLYVTEWGIEWLEYQKEFDLMFLLWEEEVDHGDPEWGYRMEKVGTCWSVVVEYM